jgi:hypothetical protein
MLITIPNMATRRHQLHNKEFLNQLMANGHDPMNLSNFHQFCRQWLRASFRNQEFCAVSGNLECDAVGGSVLENENAWMEQNGTHWVTFIRTVV